MRYDDSPDLFGAGVGAGTTGDIKCGICGTLYNEGNDERQDYNGDSTLWTVFAGLTVCDCCFEAVESEVLSRMKYILPWFIKILNRQKESVVKKALLVEEVRRAMEEP